MEEPENAATHRQIRALELILSGNFINGKQAEVYGLGQPRVSKGTVVEDALKLARSHILKSRIAIQAAIRAVCEDRRWSSKRG